MPADSLPVPIEDDDEDNDENDNDSHTDWAHYPQRAPLVLGLSLHFTTILSDGRRGSTLATCQHVGVGSGRGLL